MSGNAAAKYLATDDSPPRMAYRTNLGRAYHASIEGFLESRVGRSFRGKVNLILTSPPFPLTTKKAYGNLTGEEYVEWLEDLAPRLIELLRPNGSIVIEIGNAWVPGRPVMSTLPIRALLAFLKSGRLQLCQEFVGYNRARLPGPAEWVNVQRIRVKDAYTHVWWMSRVARPPASNRRVLTPYKPAMLELLRTGEYSSGRRPSENVVGEKTFNRDNGGAIPPNVLEFANTASADSYLEYCERVRIKPHPARMNGAVARFFIKFLTVKGGLILDPFAGSNTTGAEAQGLMRRWVCLERDARYLQGSRGRFV